MLIFIVISYDCDAYTIEYGYNTSWINEDYTHTKGYLGSHNAIVSNNNGSYSDSAKKNKWAEIEVRHPGSYVQYGVKYWY